MSNVGPDPGYASDQSPRGFRPRKAPLVCRKPRVIGMRRIQESERGQRIYKMPKQSVEPVSGIIKATDPQAMGFRQFLPRGLG